MCIEISWTLFTNFPNPQVLMFDDNINIKLYYYSLNYRKQVG